MSDTPPICSGRRWGVAGLILCAGGLLLPPLAWTLVDNFWIHFAPAVVVQVAAVVLGVCGWRHWTGKLATYLGGMALALLMGVVAMVLILTVSAHHGRPL